MNRFTLFINRVLHLFEIMRIRNNNKAVFLTFDDGPEPGITEFVLDELNKYQFKATFFCRGDNAQAYPDLVKRIVNEKHALGNHTFSHLNSFETPSSVYVTDVEHANVILKCNLFRPPKGSITLSAFMRLFRKYKIVYWSLLSGDTDMEHFDKEKRLKNLKKNTITGDVVLFHFCHRHENETKQLLPDYLCWLSENGYHSEIILI